MTLKKAYPCTHKITHIMMQQHVCIQNVANIRLMVMDVLTRCRIFKYKFCENLPMTYIFF